MDGQGRWMDNVFIERLWRSLYEDLSKAYAVGFEAKIGIGRWLCGCERQANAAQMGAMGMWTTLPRSPVLRGVQISRGRSPASPRGLKCVTIHMVKQFLQ
jgi:hypothetical protein